MEGAPGAKVCRMELAGGRPGGGPAWLGRRDHGREGSWRVWERGLALWRGSSGVCKALTGSESWLWMLGAGTRDHGGSGQRPGDPSARDRQSQWNLVVAA